MQPTSEHDIKDQVLKLLDQISTTCEGTPAQPFADIKAKADMAAQYVYYGWRVRDPEQPERGAVGGDDGR